jgi:hypothetical protein
MVLLGLLAVVGCGPSASRCDEDRVRLPLPAGSQWAGLVGETSIVNRRTWWEGDDKPPLSVLSDACGRKRVELDTLVVLVDETPYAWEQGNGTGTLRWIELNPTPRVAHAVVESGLEHVHEVGGGVVSKTRSGLVFRDDPADPNGSSVTLLDQFSAGDDIDSICNFDCLSISDGSLDGQVVLDGDDGVLVAAPGGPIYRFSLPSAQREVVMPAPAESFMLLEDPNYMLWSARGGEGGVWVRNRETREDVWLDDGTLFGGSHRVFFPWVAGERGFGDNRTTAVLDVEHGHEHVLEGSWNLSTDLPDGRLLLHEASTYGASMLDPATGALEPIDFPVSWLTVQVVGENLIARRAPLTDLDDVELIRFNLATGETTPFESFSSAFQLQPQYLWTQGGDLLFRDGDLLLRRGLDEPRETLVSGRPAYWLREEGGVEHLYYGSANGVLHRVSVD